MKNLTKLELKRAINEMKNRIGFIIKNRPCKIKVILDQLSPSLSKDIAQQLMIENLASLQDTL